MEYRIIKSGHGGYLLQIGNKIKPAPAPYGIGYIMPGFMVHEQHRFDTLAAAEKAAKNIK